MPSPTYELAHCIVCGHANARVVAERDDLRAEVEWLWAFHARRLKTDTPIRALVDRVAFSEYPPFRLVECVGCGLVYRNPMEREREVVAVYSETHTPRDVLQALHDNQLPLARRQAHDLRGVLGHGGTGLELGSYVGSFLAAAREHDLIVDGVDINACVNAFTRGLGFVVHDGTLTDLDDDRRLDLVAIWNTFDQLADPRAALLGTAKLLRPDGVLAIRVPNGAFYAARRHASQQHGRLRQAAARAVLAQNNLLGFPYRWGFTVDSATRLLESFGFTVVRAVGDTLPRTSDRWTRPWARLEERAVKSWMSAGLRRNPRRAPWIELYARPSTR
ncbi:MAG TPA: methyltransferase domain-containing protein [Gemmatimonadaceae bacterium]|nr:methyltransferase domain-containing protein [Gemmatimonadaceae bacterium]